MLLALMLILSAVSAGFVSAETVAPTYEVFGDNVNYDLTGGLAVADTTLENGAAIITNSTATQKIIIGSSRRNCVNKGEKTCIL